MRYRSFRIQNFRGIRDTTVELCPSGAGVFTLIGLNESGKTTILEAIEWFQFNKGDERSLYKSDLNRSDPSSYVPKHEKATFTGDILVTALVELTDEDVNRISGIVEKQFEVRLDRSSASRSFTVKRGQSFANGDKGDRIHRWDFALSGRRKGQKKDHSFVGEDVWERYTDIILESLPEIVYFPTFLFDQPDKVVLNPLADELPANRVYRKIIESVGRLLARPIDVKVNVVDRVLIPETIGESFSGFFLLSPNRQQQIDAAINQMSHQLSVTVLGSWSKIFGGTAADREIRLRLGVDKHPDGTPRVYVQFSIRDGVQQYDISERSLGFRWFFSFLLFTLYRPNKQVNRASLFLLDEPASNLHAGAQIQLLNSFPRIASDGSQVIYSTHSHYLINPEWLDQAFIVANGAVDYDNADPLVYDGPRASEIEVKRYRAFVGSNPDKTNYFQPVLDRLQVVPSKLDAFRPAVLVEGKGDYLILAYGLWLFGIANGDYTVIPTRGADSYSELVGLMLGWGVSFCVCFDDDVAGKRAIADLRNNWGMSQARAFTLEAVTSTLSGQAIEAMLSDSDLKHIKGFYSIDGLPTKGQIQLFFSEHLSSQTALSMSNHYRSCLRSFDTLVRSALGLEARP